MLRGISQKPSPRRIGEWPPRIAVSSWSVHSRITTGSLDIFDFPKFVREEFGLRHVELLVNHLLANDSKAFERFGHAARQAQVEVICLALSNDFTDPAAHTEEIKTSKHLLGMAKLLGASLVRINPGILGDESDDVTANHVASALKELLPEAARQNILLALENHQLFGLNPVNIKNVFKSLPNDPNVGVCLDLGNFYPEKVAIGPALLAPYAVHVHAKSYEFDAAGNETRIDYPARLQELKAAGYRGYLSIEWEGDQDQDPTDEIRKTISLIERCLSKGN